MHGRPAQRRPRTTPHLARRRRGRAVGRVV